MEKTLNTTAKNTWCPGCGNFGILEAVKKAITKLEAKGHKRENFAIFTGIGCHAKIVDFINTNTFYSLHGRSIPPAIGAKIANPDLNIIVLSGDGCSYNEGLEHLIYAAKRNVNITTVIHDNRVFALTTGQYSGVSPKCFKGKSTPEGVSEDPFNPLELMLASGATFIARGYCAKIDHLSDLIVQAVEHKGFSFVEALQSCVAWLNTYQEYNNRVYESNNETLTDKKLALAKITEWNYNNDAKIPLGVFYKISKGILGEGADCPIDK